MRAASLILLATVSIPAVAWAQVGVARERPESRLEQMARAADEVLAPCLERVQRARDGGERVDALLMFLPDPVDSPYAREFNLILDGALTAASEAGYEPDLICLPWPKEDGDEDLHHARPGLLLLRDHARARQDAKLLMLILIGEDPRAGVRQAVVHRALTLASAISPGSPIHGVGPTFSASGESIARALAAWSSERTHPRSRQKVVLRSGSATDPDVRQAFLDVLAPTRGRQRHSLEVDYRSLAATSEELQSCVWNVLVPRRLGLDTLWLDGDGGLPPEHPCAPHGSGEDNSRVALLVERSLYGSQFARGGFYVVPFTPYLPHLRAAYEEQRNGDGAADEQAGGEAHADPRLRSLPLRLGRSLTERLAFFDREGTITSQDLVLKSVLRRLARRKVQVVAIVATNVMDKLFLAEMVRELIPNARLITFEGDVLLSHPSFIRATAGTLVASSFPLTEPPPHRGDEQAGEQGVSYAHFDLDPSHGAFLAASELLRRGERRADDRAVWLSVVGRRGLHALRVIGMPPQETPSDSISTHHRRLPRSWSFLIGLVVLSVGAVLLLAFAGRRQETVLGLIPSEVLRPRRTGETWSTDRVRHVLATMLPLVVLVPCLVVCAPLVFLLPFTWSDVFDRSWRVLVFVLAVTVHVLLVLAFGYLYALLVRRTWQQRRVDPGAGSDPRPLRSAPC